MMYPILAYDPEYRHRLVVALEQAGIETRPLMPIIGQPCYRGVLEHGPMPVAEKALTHGFYIGCHQGISINDAAYIGEVARAA